MAKGKREDETRRNFFAVTEPPRCLAAIKAVTAVSRLTIFIGQGIPKKNYFENTAKKKPFAYYLAQSQTRRKQKHNPGQTKR